MHTAPLYGIGPKACFTFLDDIAHSTYNYDVKGLQKIQQVLNLFIYSTIIIFLQNCANGIKNATGIIKQLSYLNQV